MLLAIDIGNTAVKFGVFESSSLVDKFSIPTYPDYAENELLFDRLSFIRERFFQIASVVVCSVVPELDETFRSAIKDLLNVTPVFVDKDSDFGIAIEYQTVDSLGLDRLVNASAAARKYGTPIIVCSFGTATTIDVVNAKKAFVGGTISPGLRLLAESLHQKTSKLPLVTVEDPGTVIGSSTEGSIRSGVFYGYIGAVGGILNRMFSEMGKKPKVIATGGFAQLVNEGCDLIDEVDENLTLDGLRLVHAARSD